MTSHVSIAYLGPEGTHTNEAAVIFAEKMGVENPNLVPCATFDDVFDSVDRGKTQFGVVAKENSLEGPVTATLDNFAFRSNSVILAETVLDIHHSFMISEQASVETIETIASHAQGIAQCRRYLTENFPSKATRTTSSTAESARLAGNDTSMAAIANPLAAKLYGCKIIDSAIEDNLGNQTSFALIGRAGTNVDLISDSYKTTIALFVHADRAGTLNMILSEFAYAERNLTMIQSRPLKQQLGDYMFFIEFQGKDTDSAAQTALACLRLKLREVKVLGSYPLI